MLIKVATCSRFAFTVIIMSYLIALANLNSIEEDGVYITSEYDNQDNLDHDFASSNQFDRKQTKRSFSKRAAILKPFIDNLKEVIILSTKNIILHLSLWHSINKNKKRKTF
jgi:hypothetical protein